MMSVPAQFTVNAAACMRASGLSVSVCFAVVVPSVAAVAVVVATLDTAAAVPNVAAIAASCNITCSNVLAAA
jgi:hypothetical protein